LNVAGQAGTHTESGYSLMRVAEQLQQVDWKATLDGTENFKDIVELANEIATRGAGMMAFRQKYYDVLFDTLRTNRAGNLRGIVVSAKWRKLFGGLGKFGGVLSLAGIPMEAAELSWNDLSAKGIAANSMTTLARWGTETVVLGVPQTVQMVSQVAGWTAGTLGYREAANDIQVFSGRLQGSINEAEEAIERTLSVANARDVLTWDRSVINPRNWSLLAEGMRGHFKDLAAETQPLYDDVVHSIGNWFSSR
jgi:hypothetical protein